MTGVEKACQLLMQAGAKRAVKLSVGGAFHSPLMEPARQELAEAIEKTLFNRPVCPVYQNVDAKPYTDPGQHQNQPHCAIDVTGPLDAVGDGDDSRWCHPFY